FLYQKSTGGPSAAPLRPAVDAAGRGPYRVARDVNPPARTQRSGRGRPVASAAATRPPALAPARERARALGAVVTLDRLAGVVAVGGELADAGLAGPGRRRVAAGGAGRGG